MDEIKYLYVDETKSLIEKGGPVDPTKLPYIPPYQGVVPMYQGGVVDVTKLPIYIPPITSTPVYNPVYREPYKPKLPAAGYRLPVPDWETDEIKYRRIKQQIEKMQIGMEMQIGYEKVNVMSFGDFAEFVIEIEKFLVSVPFYRINLRDAAGVQLANSIIVQVPTYKYRDLDACQITAKELVIDSVDNSPTFSVDVRFKMPMWPGFLSEGTTDDTTEATFRVPLSAVLEYFIPNKPKNLFTGSKFIFKEFFEESSLNINDFNVIIQRKLLGKPALQQALNEKLIYTRAVKRLVLTESEKEEIEDFYKSKPNYGAF